MYFLEVIEMSSTIIIRERRPPFCLLEFGSTIQQLPQKSMHTILKKTEKLFGSLLQRRGSVCQPEKGTFIIPKLSDIPLKVWSKSVDNYY